MSLLIACAISEDYTISCSAGQEPWSDNTGWRDIDLTQWCWWSYSAATAYPDAAAAEAGGANITVAVLDNDELWGDAKTAVTVNLGTLSGGGAIALDGNNDVTYTPPAGETISTFNYTITRHSRTSNSAGVTIQVSAANVLSQYAFDGLNASDSYGVLDGTLYGSALYVSFTSLVTGDNGNCLFNKRAAAETGGHMLLAPSAAQNVAQGTWVIYFQRVQASDYNPVYPWRVLLKTQEFGLAGEFSIEVRTDGYLRAWFVDQSEVLKYFETGTDTPSDPDPLYQYIANSHTDIGTAYRVAMTWDGANVKLYLNDAQIGYNIASTVGARATDVYRYMGAISGTYELEAAFDNLTLYEEALTLGDIQNLPAAQTVVLDPISLYRCDVINGTQVPDAYGSVNGSAWNSLQVIGDSLVSGISGSSYYNSSGNNAHWSIPPSILHDNPTGSVTIYVQLSEWPAAGTQGLLVGFYSTTDGSFGIEVNEQGLLRAFYYVSGAAWFYGATPNGGYDAPVLETPMTIGVARRITLTWDEFSGETKLYFNNSQVGVTLTNIVRPPAITEYRYFGAYSTGVKPMIGRIDHVSWYSYALTAAQVAMQPPAVSV